MRERTLLCPLLCCTLHLLLLLARPGVAAGESCKQQAVDEAVECSEVLQTVDSLFFLTHEQVCAELAAALECAEDARAGCAEAKWDPRILDPIDMLSFEMAERECEMPSKPPPSTIPPSTNPTVCYELEHPDLIHDATRDPVVSIPVPFKSNTDTSHLSDCPQSQSNPRLEHCSLFAFSHLRPFGSDELSTCLMPGPWYLVKRPGVVEVIVRNVVPQNSVLESVTQIASVEVIFPAHACHGSQKKVYIASIASGLPNTFMDGTTSSANKNLLLNVTISKDGNNGSAILRSHSFNITISIRMHSGHFAIAIQAPEHLLEGKGLGLCHLGCPQHAEPVNVIAEEDAWCTEVATMTTLACATRHSILNGPGTFGLHYFDACRFDVLKQQDYQMVLVANMAAEDAFLLGPVEPPSPPQPLTNLFFKQVLDEDSNSTGKTPSQGDSPSGDSPLTDGIQDVLGSSSPPPAHTSPVALLLLTLTVLAAL